MIWTGVVAPFALSVSRWRNTPPALCENRSIQTALLSDVLAWIINCSLGRTGHVLNLEIFQHDQVVVAYQLGCRLLDPVLAPV